MAAFEARHDSGHQRGEDSEGHSEEGAGDADVGVLSQTHQEQLLHDEQHTQLQRQPTLIDEEKKKKKPYLF